MKIVFLSILCSVSFLLANSEISLLTGKKDYTNSKTKVDGKTYNINFSHKLETGLLSLGYLRDDVDREHPVTKVAIDTLHVKKFNGKYQHNFTDKFDAKASYIKILDNLAPTDQGKIYGLGVAYKLPKGFGTKLDVYKSDYSDFNVYQYDLTFFKGFQFGETKGKLSIVGKSIHIDGDNYGTYRFEDKSYFTTGINLGLNYQGYLAGIGSFFGKRMFTVLDDGTKVQHHAMEQDKTYIFTLGKKFQDFDIIAKYSFQNGKELPENQDDVDTKITSVQLNYRF